LERRLAEETCPELPSPAIMAEKNKIQEKEEQVSAEVTDFH
jgi:hypothetical protein